MKNLGLLVVTVLLSLSTWGGGGVDVGNHNQKGFRGTFQIPTFNDENEIVTHVQSLLPSIEDGTNGSVKRLVSQGKCSGKDIKFDELEVLTSYEYNDMSKKLNRKASGLVIVKLFECKRPNKITNQAEF